MNQNNTIFNNIITRKSASLSQAQNGGDWIDTDQIIAKQPQDIIQEISNSGLRGRGGAGFPTATKWSFMLNAAQDKPHYLIVNADESEPGTCKDRDIICFEPHKIIEGTLIASYAIGANVAYIYIRGEYYKEAKILQKAIDEAYAEKLIGKNALNSGWDLDIYLHRGAGAYICGEETALLESLEGKKGFPRLKPPFPAQYGLYGCPTIINNVETIAVVPTIMRRGSEWFKRIGTPQSTGTKIFSISGHVNKPCNVELPLGISLKELIQQYAGDVIGGWNNLLAVIPGGASTPLIPKSICDTITMDYESLQNAKTSLGTAGVIVMNQSTDILTAIACLSRFYAHESCGQCTPCREGTGWINRILQKINAGHGKKEDIEILKRLMSSMEGKTICAFGDAAVWPVQGLLRHFQNHIMQKIND